MVMCCIQHRGRAVALNNFLGVLHKSRAVFKQANQPL